MSWWVHDFKRYKHAMSEISKQRDRGAGIIAAAIVEDHLDFALATRLRTDKEAADLKANMFSGRGALGNFGAKIDLGYLFGLYDNRTRKKLHEIRLIRNDFAHKMEPQSFASNVNRCARLIAPKGLARQMNKMLNDFAKGQIEEGARIVHKTFERSKKPRTQFIRACQQMTFLLNWEIQLGQRKTWTKEPDAAPKPLLGISP